MSVYRIYVDSRMCQDPANSTHTDFEFALPCSISIKDKSLTMVACVVVPNSSKTVQHNKMT